MALIERQELMFVLPHQFEKKQKQNKKKTQLPKCTKNLTTRNVLPLTELQKCFSLLKPFLTHLSF